MSSFVHILSFFYGITHVFGSTEIDCITVRSVKSSSGQGALATSRCTTNYPTMVSCGFETFDDTDADFGGSYIDDSNSNDVKCIAINQYLGSGVYSFARCCNFTQDISCVAADGAEADDNNELSTLECNSNQFMVGCSGFLGDSSQRSFEGTYPGRDEPDLAIQGGTGSNNPYSMNHTCNAQNGGYDGTQANINCCTVSMGLECNIYYADAGRTYNYLICPNGQTMMTCMGWNTYGCANAIYISPDDSSNYNQGADVCTTRSTEKANGNNGDDSNIYTSAIWFVYISNLLP